MAIWLNMIVKDAAGTIVRTLESVRPLIGGYVIVDTGSTDGTQELVRRCLDNLPGHLSDRAWVNFEHNRNEALALAKSACGPDDYLLFMDADDVLVQVPTSVPDFSDDRDGYEIEEHDGNLRFWRPFVVRARLPLIWVGKTHEFLEGALTANTSKLTGIYRLRGAKTNEQYRVKLDRDLAILSSSDSDDPRTCFYLAQTLRDLGRLSEALAMYDKRRSLVGWVEEWWWAEYESAMLKDRLNRPSAEVMQAYLQTFEDRPQRAEPLLQLARYCRDRGWHRQAFLFAGAGLEIPFPGNDRLFVDGDIYAWKMLDEYAIAAFWTGQYELSRDSCQALLRKELLPVDRTRVEQNLAFAVGRLTPAKS